MNNKKYVIVVKNNFSEKNVIFIHYSNTIKDCIESAMKNISERNFEGNNFPIFYDFQGNIHENPYGAIGFEGDSFDMGQWCHCPSNEFYKIMRPRFIKSKKIFFYSYMHQFEIKQM